jgi:hypothetical protein
MSCDHAAIYVRMVLPEKLHKGDMIILNRNDNAAVVKAIGLTTSQALIAYEEVLTGAIDAWSTNRSATVPVVVPALFAERTWVLPQKKVIGAMEWEQCRCMDEFAVDKEVFWRELGWSERGSSWRSRHTASSSSRKSSPSSKIS